MDTTPYPVSKRAKLTALIGGLNLARDIFSPFPPARAAFGSARDLLSMIRVRHLLICHNGLLVHRSLGPNG